MSRPTILLRRLLPLGLVLLAAFAPAQEQEAGFSFGVVPQRIGQGLGSYLIDWAIHRVWSRGSHRFWLHTCTRDHPKALAFYQRAGFVPYAVQQEVLNDPFLDGTIAPDEIAPPG